MVLPSDSRSRATQYLVAPLTLLNLPPMYTEVPSGPGSSASISPLTAGWKLLSSAPVVASYAKIRGRLIWISALTWPSSACGVQLTGSSLTIVDCASCTAPAGIRTPADSTDSAATIATKTARSLTNHPQFSSRTSNDHSWFPPAKPTTHCDGSRDRSIDRNQRSSGDTESYLCANLQ